MPVTTASAAPALTPMMPGSASGLRATPCMAAPARPSAPPARSPGRCGGCGRGPRRGPRWRGRTASGPATRWPGKARGHRWPGKRRSKASTTTAASSQAACLALAFPAARTARRELADNAVFLRFPGALSASSRCRRAPSSYFPSWDGAYFTASAALPAAAGTCPAPTAGSAARRRRSPGPGSCPHQQRTRRS